MPSTNRVALEWDEMEVASRWTLLFAGPAVIRAFVAGQALSQARQQVARNHIQARFKKCLSNLFRQFISAS